MVEKKDLEYALKRWERRVGFKSEERIRTSLAFHILFSVLDTLNNRNEEELEEELKSGSVSFDCYECNYKVSLKINIKDVG